MWSTNSDNRFGQRVSFFGQRFRAAGLRSENGTKISDNDFGQHSKSGQPIGNRSRQAYQTAKNKQKITKNKFGRITFRTIGFFSTDNCTANFQGPILPWNVRFPLADVQARPPLPVRSARSAIAGHSWPWLASHG